jgi:hypothetical protein
MPSAAIARSSNLSSHLQPLLLESDHRHSRTRADDSVGNATGHSGTGIR